MMHNRRCSAAQPPDNRSQQSSRAATRLSKVEFRNERKRIGSMMSSLRDFVVGEWLDAAVALRYTAGYA
ncbi:MAG: hypothetical protein LBQ50_02150 [Planctomycetaceae bacterium]|nr:hypothetical protein [Planctomycetaceae bacterium]